MGNVKIKYFFICSAILLFLASAHSAVAAVIYILPEQKNFSLGEEFSIDVKIDSEGASINAAQATINWPNSVLQLVEAEKVGSVFNFWVDERKPSDASSSLYFIGGTTKGISGGALQILKIKFKARSSGAALISITDAAVTAHDGHGTDVLSKIKGAAYSVGAGVAPPKLPNTGSGTKLIPDPVIVEREAVPANILPQKPDIEVPLYSDQTIWNNHLGELLVLWQVPDDVTKVAVYLDHSPNTVPQNAEKELTTGKKFGILEDGIWYFHVRFENTIGWGPAGHYRIALDTKPPLPFELTVPAGVSTDDPAPVIEWRTGDELSGLKEYQVRIDDGEMMQLPVSLFKGSFTLPLQAPGSHRVVVKAVDQADNSIEDEVMLHILPIPSPIFTFVTKELFSDENRGLTVRGTAVGSSSVLLKLVRVVTGLKGEVALSKIAKVDDRGNWEFTFDEPLRNGGYLVTAQSQDARSALSLPVPSPEIEVKSKPVIQIGSFELGKGGAALALLFVLIVSFCGGILFYKKRQEKLALRVEFAGSEITKIFTLIAQDAKALCKSFKTPTSVDDEYAIKRLQEHIKKMESYLKKGIEKIKR